MKRIPLRGCPNRGRYFRDKRILLEEIPKLIEALEYAVSDSEGGQQQEFRAALEHVIKARQHANVAWKNFNYNT